MEKEVFTLTVFTENSVGMLTRITNIFTRRHLNINSITACESEVKDVYRYTIVLETTKEQVEKVAHQIERLIEVLKVFYYQDKDIVFQELALYKIKTSELDYPKIERVIRLNHARVLSIDKEFMVIEKTGYKNDTQKLFEDLYDFGILEFTRSGRVAITRPMNEISTYLQTLN
ncbi:acetolactate synthase small subunit [Myroides sp. LJL119]